MDASCRNGSGRVPTAPVPRARVPRRRPLRAGCLRTCGRGAASGLSRGAGASRYRGRVRTTRPRTEAVVVIPISVVDVRDAEQLVLEVIRSGVIAQGPMVKRLEEAFAEIVGVRHAVAVNNGTTALVAALQVPALEPGAEVVTSPFTFVATPNAILEAGATAPLAAIS